MNKQRRQRGAAVVEFAVLAVLLLVFLVGIFEFGFLWLQSNYIANAAREGARVAAKIGGTSTTAVDQREDAAEVAVKDYLRPLFLYRDKVDSADYPDFIVTTYQRPEPTISVTTGTETIQVPMAEVTVTVKTHLVWDPVLWPLLSALIPGADYDENFLRQLTQKASYAIQN
jgi:Flp pilus assembly protein TadG